MLLLITLLKVVKNWRGPCLGLLVATFVLLRLIDGGGKQQRLVMYVCSEPIDDIQPPGAYRGRLSELGLALYRPQT